MPISGHLSEEIKITTVAPVVTGTTTITGAAIDMTGFDGVLIVVRLGAPATNNNLRVSQCDTVGGSYADVVGTLVGNHATDNPSSSTSAARTSSSSSTSSRAARLRRSTS